MKTLGSRICKVGQYPSYSGGNLKNCVSFIPKALIIKMEDIKPRRIYKEICEQSFQKCKLSYASDWYINNRYHCADYIKYICELYQLHENTFFAALSFVDRILKFSQNLPKKEFDLVIISCLLLAAKYVENDAYEIALNEFYSLDGNELYMKNDIKAFEVYSLKELKYNLNEASPYDYLACQIACGVVFKDEVIEKDEVNKFYCHARSLLTKISCLVYGLIYPPAVVALSVIHLTRNHFLFDQKRMRNIKAKLHFTQDKDFEELLQVLKE